MPTFLGSKKKQRNSRKTSTSASLTTLKPLTVWITTNWKILKEMRIPDHLTCSWETCTQVKKQQLEPIWKNRLVQNWERSMSRLYIVTWLFNFYAEYIMWNASLDEAQGGIKIAERNINNLRYADDTTLMAESKQELNSLLMKVKEESEKAGLLRPWHPVPSLTANRWGKNGNSGRFYFLELQNHCVPWLQPWN